MGFEPFFFNHFEKFNYIYSILRWPFGHVIPYNVAHKVGPLIKSPFVDYTWAERMFWCTFCMNFQSTLVLSVSLWFYCSLFLWRNVDSFLSFVSAFLVIFIELKFVIIFSSWLVFLFWTSWQLSHRPPMFNWIKMLLRVQNYAINCNYLHETKVVCMNKRLEYWIYFMHESCLCIYKGRLMLKYKPTNSFNNIEWKMSSFAN